MEDTEGIVAKAIRDGGIEAEIDHTHGWVTSRASPDAYATADPQADFHERIAFCLDLHNEVLTATVIHVLGTLFGAWDAMAEKPCSTICCMAKDACPSGGSACHGQECVKSPW